jgi:hypothetical protein
MALATHRYISQLESYRLVAAVCKAQINRRVRPQRTVLESIAMRLRAGLVRLERDLYYWLAMWLEYRAERQAIRCPSLRGPT